MTSLVAPLMSAWMRNRVANRAALLLPSDAPFVTEPGADPDRIALIGSGAVAGIGVRSHQLGLPGTIARALAVRTERGATVEAFGRPEATLADIPALVDGVRLSRYDAIVVLAGMEDAIAMRPPHEWRTQLGDVLDALQSAAARDTAVLVLGVPQVSAIGVFTGLRARAADQQAKRLNRVTRSMADVRKHLLYGPLSVPEGTGRIASHLWYDVWGVDIADALAPVLAPAVSRPTAARDIREAAEAEAERVRALDRTGFVRGERVSRFDRIASLAHELLGGDVAAVGFLDEDTHWYGSTVGFDAVSDPRSASVCDHTVQQGGAYIVGDMQQERRLQGHPVVWGDAGMRFYAGFPIESPDGYRIGTVCVLGKEPRDPGTVDVEALRRLAAMARAEVWESTKTESAPAPAGFATEDAALR